MSRVSGHGILSPEFQEIWADPALRYSLIAEGERMEAESNTGLYLKEILKSQHKMFALLDAHAKVQVLHFPKLNDKMSGKGFYEWAYPEKVTASEIDEAKQRMAGFAGSIGRKRND